MHYMALLTDWLTEWKGGGYPFRENNPKSKPSLTAKALSEILEWKILKHLFISISIGTFTIKWSF